MPDVTIQKEVLAVGKHSLIYLVGPAISRAVGFFLIPMYTKFIAPASYGVMALADILMGLAMMVLSLHVADSMVRFFYAEEDETQRKCIVSTAVLGLGTLGIPITVILVALSGPCVHLIADESQYRLYLLK